MAANMYRVGDYVYFETSSSSPYLIRRIEELNKTPNGNVEAKVMCFYRRRDVPSSLMMLADKHHVQLEEERESNEDLSENQQHQLKHRELFLSRSVETLPATHIRGKCSVTLLNETESLLSYLNKEDTFFYSLVYDPQQRTLLADKGEIRVGGRYQAEPTQTLEDDDRETDDRDLDDLEELVWNPDSGLADKEVDQFMVVARSVGTFARALDCTSTVRQPSLHMSAAAASRDVTLFHAMDTLHNHDYDISKAISSLVPPGGPVLCRDEMEEWSASEANLFEEALDKYGKDFNDIRQDFLPWKTLKSIVEYYYMWKTTDRYVQQKRIKAAEAESKLKQVYIPNYNKPNPAAISNKVVHEMPVRACESCFSSATAQWYAWGPVHMQCRLCATCWGYWKKQGGLKMPTRLDGERPAPNQRTERLQQQMRTHKCTISGCGKEFKLKTHLARHLATAHNLTIRSGSPRPIMKTRAAFCLITTPLTRISRIICKDILKPTKAARNPISPVNIATIKQECQSRLPSRLDKLPKIVSHQYLPILKVLARLGVDEDHPLGDLLTKTPSTESPLPIAYPRPSAEEIEARREKLDDAQRQTEMSRTSSSIMRKRGYEETNGVNGPPAKKSSIGMTPRHIQPGVMRNNLVQRAMIQNNINGRSGRIARKQILSWVDAPDDVYFIATDNTRKVRKQLIAQDFKRAARKPWRKLNVKTPIMSNLYSKPVVPEDVVILD